MQRTISIVFNPISGSGKSRRYAESLAAELSRKGYVPRMLESKPRYTDDDYRDYLHEAQAVAVCGGDGTIVGLLDGLSRFEKPFSMLPTGNQSLFARHFGVKLDVHAVVSAIERNTPSSHFYRTVNGRPFFHMASVGLDSEVVKQLCVHRTGPVGNIGYVMPLLKVLTGYGPQPLWIENETGAVVTEERGYVICGGTDQYALGLKFIPEASSTDPIIHARFFPCASRTRAAVLPMQVLCGCMGQGRAIAGSVLRIRGAEGSSLALQADGEYMGELPVEIRTAERPVLVLR